MMARSMLLRCLLIVFLVIGVAHGPRTTEASEPITIGVLHSETYPYAAMMRNSYQMALDTINRDGGIKGRPLNLVFADDRGKREAGENAVRQLIKQSAPVMLVGGYASSNTVYTARIADKLNVPLLITTAADDRITQRKWTNVYRMNPPAGEYAKGVEELLQKHIKPTSMAIVYENSPYGTGAALRMMWFCREYDIALSKLIPYHKERANAAYFQDILEPLRDDTPDVIYMVSYLNDAVLLVKTLRERKIDSLLIGGAGGFTHQKFISMAGDAAEGVLTATLWTQQLPYPGAQEYYNFYQKKYSVSPDYHGAEAYAALFVVADVLKRADSFRPESIRAALNETNVKTAFGPVVFQQYGKFERQNSLPTMVLQVVDEAFEVVWPEDIATSKLTVPTP
ncbi:MAG: ABC transporter substrate-binding protein [Gammaproteobacteria bacterium]|nr:ABC transporter substrate-binding protein [Gammaproteobacteria bacterium]